MKQPDSQPDSKIDKEKMSATTRRNDAPSDKVGTVRILAHICCAPCSIAPLKSLMSGKAEITGYFRNPNIHPRLEFERRLDSVRLLAKLLDLKAICDETYAPRDFIKGQMKASKAAPGSGENHIDIKLSKKGRCDFCYAERLEATAKAARDLGFDGFTTSLLYSMSQDHAEIKRVGAELARKYGVHFHYDDFRKFWNDGITRSKAAGLYRQQYCGCVFSRVERYAGSGDKKKAK